MVEAYEVYEQTPGEVGGPRRIYIGNLASSKCLGFLKSNDINVIVNCTYTSACFHKDRFEYCRLQMSDDESQDLELVFAKGTKFLQEKCNNRNLLVHCRQGQSRSVSVVLAWMIKYKGLTLCQALKKVRTCHPSASPNLGFLQQLSEFASKMRGDTAFDQLQFCKICSKLGFSQENFTFSKCGHSLCVSCKEKEEINLLFCPHCLAEANGDVNGFLIKQHAARAVHKPSIRRSEIIPLRDTVRNF